MESESSPGFAGSPSGKELLRKFGIEIVEYSPEEWAGAVHAFYKALLELGLEKEFAERLAVAFCGRP